MMGSLDFFGLGDNRIAEFQWNGLSDLNSVGCSSCSGITFGGQVITSQVTYMDEGFACLVQYGGFCGLGEQKQGPIPLGDNCYVTNDLLPPLPTPTYSNSCPENGIATNGDGVTQVSYADGQLWTGISTLIYQSFGGTTELHIGATYWGIDTDGKSISIARQGYVSAAHEESRISGDCSHGWRHCPNDIHVLGRWGSKRRLLPEHSLQDSDRWLVRHSNHCSRKIAPGWCYGIWRLSCSA